VHKTPGYLFTLLVATTIAGCAVFNEVRFSANPSPLDYVQFRISRPSVTDGKQETIRLDLSGSGFLEITTGGSERVLDGFWKESSDPAWQDIRRDHVFLSEQDTIAVFQSLVDLGMFDRRQDPEKNPPPHHLAILASINTNKRLILTGQPEYNRIFDMLLERVTRP